MSLISSGRAFIRIDMMTVLIQTDFPEPVAPAMRQWGIFAMSLMTFSPVTVFPSRRGIIILRGFCT